MPGPETERELVLVQAVWRVRFQRELRGDAVRHPPSVVEISGERMAVPSCLKILQVARQRLGDDFIRHDLPHERRGHNQRSIVGRAGAVFIVNVYAIQPILLDHLRFQVLRKSHRVVFRREFRPAHGLPPVCDGQQYLQTLALQVLHRAIVEYLLNIVVERFSGWWVVIVGPKVGNVRGGIIAGENTNYVNSRAATDNRIIINILVFDI